MPASVPPDTGAGPSRRRGVKVPVAVGAVGLLVLAGAQYGTVRQGIEEDLTTRSTTALQEAGLTGVGVAFSGQDATLTGVPAGSAEAAIAAVRRVDGVREVTVTQSAAVAAGTATATATPAPPATSSPTATPTPTATETATATPTASSTPAASPSPTPTPTPAPTPAEPSTEDLQARIDAVGRLDFASGSSTLTPRGRAAATRLAALLADASGARVLIEGHTDDSGTARVNRELSAARARTVRLTLQYRGIDRSRLSSVGRGETRPLRPNTSEAARAANRRVEVTVLPG